MNEIEECKNQMAQNAKEALRHLEHAMSTVEANDKFNNGQNEEINKLYDSVSEVWKKLNDLIEID